MVITAVHYQARRMLFVYGPDDLRHVTSGRTGHGSSGMLIVMAGPAGTGQPAAAAGTVLVLLAAAAFALTRAILRPPRAAAHRTRRPGRGRPARGGAGTRAREWPPRAVRHDAREHPRTAAGRPRSRSRGPAADMSGHLAETCPPLRRPVSIVYGFAGYLRQQGTPQPASLDRMLHRVAGEITRMETPAQGLRMPPAGASTGPDRQPGPPAIGPAGRARPQDNRQPSASASHAK
ncbi:MAG TPA: hypothetical protein VF070_11080 [Streptosporangiaceae bacterium]